MNFGLTKKELNDLVALYIKNTEVREEIKQIEKHGGSKYFLHGLTSHLKKGIRKGSIVHRAQAFGVNVFIKQKPQSFWKLLIQVFKDWVILLMIFVCIATLIIDMTTTSSSRHKTTWIESASILIAMLICCLGSALNDYYKETQFNKLHILQQQRKKAAVIRQNDTVEVTLDNIVVGDILIMTKGMIVPVDVWMIEVDGIQVDESHILEKNVNLKKESMEKISKITNEQQIKSVSSLVLSGSQVLCGQGKGIVLVVGESRAQYTYALPKQPTIFNKTTPLREKLQKLTYNISVFGIVSSCILLATYVIRFVIYKLQEKSWSTEDLPIIFRFMLLCITIIMVSVPQGLPLSISLSLGHSFKKMVDDQNLVRNLQAPQRMGQVSVVCTNKCGVITSNKMDVVSWWNQQRFDVGDDLEAPIKMSLHKDFKQLMLINLFVNSSADIKPYDYGSTTQTGLIRFGERFNQTYGDYRMNYSSIQKLTFNSVRKRTSAVVEYEGHNYMFTKGAGEILLDECTHFINHSEPIIQQIDKDIRKQLQNQIKEMSLKGLRIIVLAYKKLEKQIVQGECESILNKVQSKDLVLQAILGILDPVRTDVKQYVKACRDAGIDVKIVTGQNLNSAISLAKEVGIIQPNRPSLCLQGQQFQYMIGGLICQNCRSEQCPCIEEGRERKDVIKNLQDFDRIVRRLDVLARVRPEDRYSLMIGLKNKGLMVAITGSKKSDIQSMNVADVSFSAGVNGSQMTRKASSMILLDDNFNSILKSAMWGRNIYDVLRKFIQFQLTVNAVAVIYTLIGVIFLDQQPLSPIQMIWLNVIMDTLASLALATQQPSSTILERGPNQKDESIINRRMWKHIISQAIFQLIILVVLLFFGEYIIPEYTDQLDSQIEGELHFKYYLGKKKTVASGRLYKILSTDPDYLPAYEKLGIVSRHFTFIFNAFVFLQIFNFFNCRKIYDELNVFKDITSNLLFVFVVGCVVVIQVLIVTFGSSAFELYPYYGLRPIQWLMSIGIGASSLLLSLIIKMIPESQQNTQNNDLRKRKVNRSGNLALRMKEFDTSEQSESNLV